MTAKELIDARIHEQDEGGPEEVLQLLERVKLDERERKDLEMRLSTKFSNTELRKLATMLLTLLG